MDSEGPYSNASRKRAHEDSQSNSRRDGSSHFRDPAAVNSVNETSQRGGHNQRRPNRGGRSRGRPYRGRGSYAQQNDRGQQRDGSRQDHQDAPMESRAAVDVEEGE